MVKSTTIESFQASQTDGGPTYRSFNDIHVAIKASLTPRSTFAEIEAAIRAEIDRDGIGLSDAEIHSMAQRLQVSLAESAPAPSPLAQLAERMVRERGGADPTAEEIAEQLAGLDILGEVDAHMALGEIKSRVWTAADAAGIPATAEQIDAEAERIWTHYGDTRRASEAQYSVGPDGLVDGYERTARPALVEAKAVEMPEMPLKPLEVIKDSEFGDDDDYFVSGALANRARVLISRHPEHLDHLRRLSVTYLWKRQGGKSKGRATFGKCSKPSGLLKHFSEAHFVIWLAADHCRAAGYTDREIEALLFHEMLHTAVSEVDENTGRGGGPTLVPHELEVFRAEVEIYGLWAPELQDVAPAFQQASLFDPRLTGPSTDINPADLGDADDEPTCDSAQVADSAEEPLRCSVCGAEIDEEGLSSEELSDLRASRSVLLCDDCGDEGIIDDGLDGEAAG